MSGRFVFTNGRESCFSNSKERNLYVFSNMEKLLPESDIRVQRVFIDLVGFVGADFWHFKVQYAFTHWLYKVSACCCCMNRSIPVPTSHNEISCEVFSAVLFVVAIAVWVEVWKRFSHVSFSFVGGFWIWLQSSDLSFTCRKRQFLSVTTEI